MWVAGAAVLKRIAAVAISAYLAVGLALFVGQDAMIFSPSDATGAPSDERISAGDLATADGERLVFWQAKPPTEACPTLIWFHGNAASLHLEPRRLRRILDAGLGLAAVAYRGYGGSTGAPGEAGLKLDAMAAYEAVMAEGRAAQDVVVMGTSLGSGLAVWLASERPVGAVVLEAPFLSLAAVVAQNLPFYPTDWLLRHPFRSDLAMPAVTAPVLAVHGGQDKVVPPRHSEALLALSKGRTKRVVIEAADHNTLVRDGMFETAVVPFLAELYPGCGGTK